MQENEFYPIFVIRDIYLAVVCLIENLDMLVWDYTTCCMPSLRLKFCLHENIYNMCNVVPGCYLVNSSMFYILLVLI